MTSAITRARRKGPAVLGLLLAVNVIALTGVMTAPAGATPTSPNLGTAAAASVISATPDATSTGLTVLAADLDVSPAGAASGFPPGLVGGATHLADATALQAQSDLTTAYNAAAGATMTAAANTDLGGKTLTSGVYTASTAMSLTGQLTLSGDPSSVFIFQAGSTLTTAVGSSVLLVGGVQACNVWWQVGSSAALFATNHFVGNIMALTSITLDHGTTLDGRALARNGEVTMDDNTIFNSPCTSGSGGGATTTSTVATVATTTAVTTGVTTATTSALPQTSLALTSVSTTTVPAVVGPPKTGGAPLRGHTSGWLPVLIISLLGSGAMASGFGLRALRRLQRARR